MSTASREEEIFCAAHEKNSLAERVAYLDDVCRDDPDLRRRVVCLLEADQAAGAFLETPIEELHRTVHSQRRVGEHVGAQFGAYKLLQELGEGGMGTVFLAEQQQPVKRRVAVKLLKAGMDSQQILRRFEVERQTLALMDHPNVAKVFDAGVTSSGRPYFVMELARGVPIVEYCDEQRLPIRQRLELFQAVCQAIQHAHQKGIIHRDVKPSNVLVCQHEGRATVKVIDFGVAKVLLQQLSGESVHTEIGQIVGTLEYMSPEQAQLSNADVDTRADIYSLGVLLYELLTGSTPLDRPRLKGVPLTEILRMIREDESPKPSSRLTRGAGCQPANAANTANACQRTLDENDRLATCPTTDIAAQRSIDPARLIKQVRGELDWIVIKCLEKDRARRYETAAALALDIERHLHDEPVEAGPPSASYRLRKLARRHKGPVVAASLVFLSLVGGIIGTSLGLVRARASAAAEKQSNVRLDAANQQLTSANRQVSAANTDLSRSREETEQKRQDAESEKAIAVSVNDFMQELLSQADSDNQGDQGFKPDPNLTVKEALTRAAARIGERFQDQPRVEAATRQTIGGALTKIGEAEAAIPHLERARKLLETQPEADDDRLMCVLRLASAFEATGQLSKSEALLEQTMAQVEKNLGPDDERTLTCMNNLAATYTLLGKFEKAVPLLETIRDREVRQYGPDAKRTVRTLSNLATNYQNMGRLDKALPLMEQLADLGDLIGMNNLVHAYLQAGHPQKALPLSEQVVTQTRERWGPDHPLTLSAMNGQVIAYVEAGHPDKALALSEQLVIQTRARWGPDHPQTLSAMHGLAGVYYYLRQYDKSLLLSAEELTSREKSQGADHPDTLVCMSNLARAYYETGQHEKALPLAEHVFQKYKERFGQDHPITLACMESLAEVYCKVNRVSDGIALFEQTIALTEKKLGPNHPILSAATHELGVTYAFEVALFLAIWVDWENERSETPRPLAGSNE